MKSLAVMICVGCLPALIASCSSDNVDVAPSDSGPPTAELAGGPQAVDDGHCDFILETTSVGPYKVCQMPTDAALCEKIGSTNDNADAVQGEGECSAENAVGTCDTGDRKITYYEGDPSRLGTGCGFQGGEWVLAK